MAPPCWREAVSGPSWPPLPSPVPHGLGAGPGHQDPPCAQGCLRLCPVWGNVSTCLQWVPRAPSPAPQLQAHRGRGETFLMFSWSGNSRSAPLSERRELPCLLLPARVQSAGQTWRGSRPVVSPISVSSPSLTQNPWKQGQDSRLQNWKPGHQGRGGKTVLSPRPLRLAGGGAALAWPDSSLGFLVAPPDTPLPHVTLSLAGHTAVRPAAEGRASSLDLVWEHLPEEMTG